MNTDQKAQMNEKRSSMELMKRQLRTEDVSDRELFESLLLWFTGTPYVWGGSSPEGSDCSGSVCCALNSVYGTHIRVTADALYRLYFTCSRRNQDAPSALFFLDRTGKAVHVAGSIGDDCVVNVSSREPGNCGTVRDTEEMRDMYRDLRLVFRSLDPEGWIQ